MEASVPTANTPSLPESVLNHIPDTTISKTALSIAYTNLPLPIFHHSFRVFLLAKHLITVENTPTSHYVKHPDLDLLFIACIFHDMGACNLHNGPQRFEVEGADAASLHLHSHGISEETCHQVWTAIALHTSPGIAERISPLARIVRQAVLMDFGAPLRDVFGADGYCQEIEVALPRLDVEKCLGDVVVGQAVKVPGKAPAVSWPNALLKAHLRDLEWEGINPEFFGGEKPGRGL
ncbi:metal dependent phosphohydrolase [Aureobasidium pullulans]|nr:metal dependent phosphohydrolase [Aureobasidium pullulans]